MKKSLASLSVKALSIVLMVSVGACRTIERPDGNPEIDALTGPDVPSRSFRTAR